MTAKIRRPDASEYAPHYGTYISNVPDDDVLRVLEEQRRETQRLLADIPDTQALHRYAPGSGI